MRAYRGILSATTLLVIVLMFIGSSPRAGAQVLTDPGWGLAEVTCIQGVFGGPVTFPVDDLTLPQVFCRDLQVSATFGHIFTSGGGMCENGIPVGAITLEARWGPCASKVLSGEADVNINTDIAPNPFPACGDPTFIRVGEIEGNAIIRDFFLGTIIAAGLGGFADCAGESSEPIPPSVGQC